MESFRKILEADISDQLPTLSKEDAQELLHKVLEVAECIEDLPHVDPSDLQPPLKKATAKRLVSFLETKYGDVGGESEMNTDLKMPDNMTQLSKPIGNKPKVPTKPHVKYPKLLGKPESLLTSQQSIPDNVLTIKPTRNEQRFPPKPASSQSSPWAKSDDAALNKISINHPKIRPQLFPKRKSPMPSPNQDTGNKDTSPAGRTNDKMPMKSNPSNIALGLSKCNIQPDERSRESQECDQTKGTEKKQLAVQGCPIGLDDSSQSNAEDDEDPMTSNLPQYKLYMHSFSFNQKDLISKPYNIHRTRPSSVEYQKGSYKAKSGQDVAASDASNDRMEPPYAPVFENDPNSSVNFGTDAVDGDDDSWGSDEFDSDEFSDEDSFDGLTMDKSPALKEAMQAVKRKSIVTELLTTERAYVKRLYLIDQEFHLKIVIENRTHHMFPDDVIPQMFSNIKSIYQFHNDFLLPQLETRIADWDKSPKIGDLMRKFAPFLKLYPEYVKNFDHAIKTIKKWQQRSNTFACILAELQQNPESEKLSLQHHMLEPIQRIPRYEMLLKDYLKHLQEDSEDRPDTEKALELVTTAAVHANKTMARPEKFWKLLELNQMFKWQCDVVVDLTDAPRELIKEGQIFKISARNGTQFDRYLFLFTDLLLVCTDHRKLGRYHVHNVLKVDDMTLLDGDNPEMPFTFYVETTSKTVELQGRTQREKDEWVSTIQSITKDQEQKRFQKHRLGHHAPRWVKDQKASMCMVCTSLFTMIRRRHHCRSCGIVVCGECSSHKIPLPYQDNKPDRVCGLCYEALKLQTDELQVNGSDPSVVSGMVLMSSDKKIWERRWFALHENFVLYSFNTSKDTQALTSTSLRGYIVNETSTEDHVSKGNIIKISHPDGSVLMYIDSPDHWIKWLVALQRAVYGEHPPSYVPVKKITSTQSPDG